MADRRLQAVGGGDARKQIADLQRRIEKLERAGSLRSASISGGNLTVRDGGSIVVEEPGTLLITDSEGNVLFDARKSTIIPRAKGRQVTAIATTADGGFHEAIDLTFTIPAGFNQASVYLGGEAGHTVSGSGNSWIGCSVGAEFLDSGGNPVPSPSTQGAVAQAYTPFHPSGGPAAPATVGAFVTEVPATAVVLRCVVYYAISLSGQTRNAGAGNATLTALVTWGHTD